MAKLTSFISEHTVEYFLLADLATTLLVQFRLVVPFYFWSGREGSNLSKSIGGIERYKCLVIYPRRPKLNASYPNEVHIKFNESISSNVAYFINNNIPVVAGIPNATALADLSINSLSCIWFQLIGHINSDIEYAISNVKEQLLESSSIRGPISKLQIAQLLKETELKSWEEIVETITKSRKPENQNHRSSIYGWHSNYKPIFIVAAE